MHKTPSGLGPLLEVADVEKVHAVVERSTFPSQNVQSTPCSDDFWKLRCRKRARRCCAKRIAQKTDGFGPLFDVQNVRKQCTPLWRERTFPSQNVQKKTHVRLKKVHAVLARSTCPSQNVQSTTCTDHFLDFQMSFLRGRRQAQGIVHVVDK